METGNATPRKNRYMFGLGTFGRDMVYTMMSVHFIFYLTDILNLDDATMWGVTVIMLICRIFDVLNDPFMGKIVDGTTTKHGKYKPYIAWGGIATAVIVTLIFMDTGLKGGAYLAVFGILYLLWGMAFTVNDISYWSMMPSLSLDQNEREKIGSIARICASLGMFIVVAGAPDIAAMIGNSLGDRQQGWFIVAVASVVIMLCFQCFTLFGVKEPKLVIREGTHTSVKEMLLAIVKNDQLLFTAISMSLFMIGYCTTTGFGLHYFKYIYGDEGMYSTFAVILGVSQLLAYALFPRFSKKFSRKALFSFAMALVFVGYVIFFFAPTTNMLFIGISGILIFIGQAFIAVMMLMFLADCIEYGQWKLNKRNDAVTFALQPFINKLGSALGGAVVSAVVILSGINAAASAADMTPQGILLVKLAMFVLPLVLIAASYLIYMKKYKIDAETYKKIIGDLRERGDIK